MASTRLGRDSSSRLSPWLLLPLPCAAGRTAKLPARERLRQQGRQAACACPQHGHTHTAAGPATCACLKMTVCASTYSSCCCRNATSRQAHSLRRYKAQKPCKPPTHRKAQGLHLAVLALQGALDTCGLPLLLLLQQQQVRAQPILHSPDMWLLLLAATWPRPHGGDPTPASARTIYTHQPH